MHVDYPTQRPHLAVVTKVVDGDTIHCDIDMDLRLWYRDYPVRLAGCNAAEKDTEAGMAAKDHLVARLPVGSQLLLLTIKDYKYGGEFVARVFTNEGSVELVPELIAQQWLAEWDGTGHPAPVPPWPRTVP